MSKECNIEASLIGRTLSGEVTEIRVGDLVTAFSQGFKEPPGYPSGSGEYWCKAFFGRVEWTGIFKCGLQTMQVVDCVAKDGSKFSFRPEKLTIVSRPY